MEITLNNRKEIFEAETMTVTELLQIKNFTFKMLIVKINEKLIRKEEYSSAIISDGNQVMVLHLISGG